MKREPCEDGSEETEMKREKAEEESEMTEMGFWAI